MLKKIRNLFLMFLILTTLSIVGFCYVLSSDIGDDIELVKNAKENINTKITENYENQRKQAMHALAKNLGYEIVEEKNSEISNNQTEHSSATNDTPKDSSDNSLISNKELNQDFEHLEIAYFYDHSSAPNNLTKKEVLDSINKASNEWKEACNISFKYKGDRLSDYVTIETTLNREEGIIKWGELEGDAIGMAHQGTIKGYAEGFVLLLNPDFFEDERNKSLVYPTVLHELGHVVGLDHNQNRKSVMYASQSHTKQNLSQTDKALCKYYRARWSGKTSEEASEKYGILLNE